jgi:hypothetical protein
MVITIPPGSLITNEVRNLPGLDRFTRVLITLSEDDAPLPTAASPLTSRAHVLRVQVIEGINTVDIINFNHPIKIEMGMPIGHIVGTHNINAYINHSATTGWQMLNSTFTPPRPRPTIPTIGDVDGGAAVTFETIRVGAYTVMSTPPPQTVGGGATMANMHRVNAHLMITDMGVYNEATPVHANQFNQILAAIILNQDTVEMKAPIGQETFVSLGRSGMLVSGHSVTRQEGISSLVRLFELRIGQPVVMYPGLAQSMLGDMSAVDPQFLTRMLQAEALGCYRTPTVSPHGYLTFGDLMFILDLVLS